MGSSPPCAGVAGAEAAVKDDARLVESVEVVESWMYSISWKVCSVASAAKDTRRFARDLRRASLLSLISVSSRSRSSRSLAAACCSASVLTATFVPSAFGSLFSLEGSCFDLGLCGGISGRGWIVGLRIERGGGRDGTASDYLGSVSMLEIDVLARVSYGATISIPWSEPIREAQSHALASGLLDSGGSS